jgi:hypothetical protein
MSNIYTLNLPEKMVTKEVELNEKRAILLSSNKWRLSNYEKEVVVDDVGNDYYDFSTITALQYNQTAQAFPCVDIVQKNIVQDIMTGQFKLIEIIKLETI